MRRANMETATIKMLLLGASIILTCILITMGFMNMRQARTLANATGSQMDKFTQDVINADIMTYDGLVVRGSDVINFYKKYFTDAAGNAEFALIVGGNSYAAGELAEIKNSAGSKYIKPTWKYEGGVAKNENGIIMTVTFTLKP